jgi:hypothetical protein
MQKLKPSMVADNAGVARISSWMSDVNMFGRKRRTAQLLGIREISNIQFNI